MKFNKAIEESVFYWSEYFKKISTMQSLGLAKSFGDGIALFPNIIIATELDDFFAFELIGANPVFTDLTPKRHKEKSIYRYLNQFDKNPEKSIFHLDDSNNMFRFLTLAQTSDIDKARQRFPFLDFYKTQIVSNCESESIFSLGENFRSFSIENSTLVNKKENLLRCKSILSLFIFRKNITSSELISLYDNSTEEFEVAGIHTANENDKKILIGGTLQSLVLQPGLRETTIGEFINKHPEIIKEAFKTDHFLYEPEFLWMEHDGTCEDTSINPDLMIRRPDGFYDILDLKTALIDNPKITKSRRNRRRFIDSVNEGIAQLANYREYFSYKRNRIFARDKYGIEVNSPKMILLIGSWENVNTEEVLQACRPYGDISIMDYDTLCHLFIGVNEEIT